MVSRSITVPTDAVSELISGGIAVNGSLGSDIAVRFRQGCAGQGDIRIFFQFWFTLGNGNEGESTTRMYVEGRCSCSKKSLPSDVILNLVRSSLRFDGWSVTNTSLSIRYVISMICRLPSVWIV